MLFGIQEIKKEWASFYFLRKRKLSLNTKTILNIYSSLSECAIQAIRHFLVAAIYGYLYIKKIKNKFHINFI